MKETKAMKATLKITKKQSAEVNEWLDQGKEVLIPSVAYIRKHLRGVDPFGKKVRKLAIRNVSRPNRTIRK